MRRVLPAIGLYFLASLVAEFLLGDIEPELADILGIELHEGK